MMRLLLLLFFLSNLHCLAQNDTSAQDTVRYIRVHFLYGSRPAFGNRPEEKRVFGGLHGGHVAIEAAGRTVGFNPLHHYHIFPHKKKKQGAFSYDFGNLEKDTIGRKFLTFIIPVTPEEEQRIDSLHSAYLKKTPYDYAMFGFRCASATWDILEETSVLEKKSRMWKVFVIFYPRRIRKRMIRYAEEERWEMIRNEGRKSRVWEKDH